MTTKELMSVERLRLFSFTTILIPLSIATRYVSNAHGRVYEWKELRVFGIRIAMWGAIG